MRQHNKTLITAALPYANGQIHVGHLAGAYLPADIYHRYLAGKGEKSLFICGSDEYGIAITIKAEEAKRTPQQQVDHFHEINKKLFSRMGIDFSHYSRTSLPHHAQRTQAIFKEHLHNGWIEKKTIHQLFSPAEGRFLADRYVVGTCPKCGYHEARGDECTKCGASFEATDLLNPVSKMTKKPLELKETEHYFFRFDLFKERLKKWLETKNFKPATMNFSRQYIEDLKPRCITRDLDWGVPLPIEGTKGKVLYVWYDAPIGYISATYDLQAEYVNEYWLDPKTRYVQFVGKDNTTFHSVLFPAMIMGQDTPYKLVDDLVVNEFLNLKGEKFSKSSGNSLDLESMLRWISPDQLRFYLSLIAPEHQDCDFSFEDLIVRVNSELVGKLGNFIHRTLTFIQSKIGSVPKVGVLEVEDQEFLNQIEALLDTGAANYENFSIKKAVETLLEMAQLSNRYFDHQKPWSLVKDPLAKNRLETILAVCLKAVQALLAQMGPVVPFATKQAWGFLGHAVVPPRAQAMSIEVERLEPPQPLFQKLEPPVKDETMSEPTEACQLQTAKTAPVPDHHKELTPMIEFSDFEKVDLRVALVLECVAVPKSEKLLQFTLDVAGEKRVILSGVRQFVQDPAALVGKKVAIVANLKPRKMMGIESHGMILSVMEEGVFEMLSFSSAPSGGRIG
jgi:methionyl-tRNA synthetase